MRASDTFTQTSAEELVRKGADEAAQAIEEAMGGVFFVDEAYMLEPDSSKEGRAILTQLLTVAEDRRTEISIILAGYKDDIENKLYAANPGVKSRFQRGEIMFEDYNEAELRRILLGMVHKHRWRLEDERVTNVVARRVARARGTKGFANARSMRIALEIAYQAAMQRAPGTTTYQTVDFIG